MRTTTLKNIKSKSKRPVDASTAVKKLSDLEMVSGRTYEEWGGQSKRKRYVDDKGMTVGNIENIW